MRTLKKTLCLVLCLAMMAGLCAVSSLAAFKDDAEINYKEAVEVLSAVGVINGMDDGKFVPAGTLTRAQACKIIAYMLGDEDVKGTCSFTDCKGHWAEGYIAYCAGKEIVNGVGDGKFLPDATLTGSAFCKMVLVALGYNADNEKMTGAAWEVGVGSLVKKTELTKGIAKFDGTKDLTREEACQIAFNALTIPMVAYGDAGVVIKTDDVEIIAGASKAEPTGDFLGVDLKVAQVKDGKAVLNQKKGTDDNGMSYYTYYKTGDKKQAAITSKFYTEEVLGEYAAGTTAKAICADQGIDKNSTAKVTVVINGKETVTVDAKDYVAKTDKIPANASVKVVAAGEDAYKLIATVEYLAKAKLGAKVADKEDKNYGKYAWTFGDYTKAVVYDEKDAYTKDALYLVVPENDNTAATKLLSITEPEVVTGTVASKGSNYVKVDGEKLTCDCAISTLNFKDSYDFYKYTSGIVGAVALHEEKVEEVTLNNVYVIAKAAKAAGASKTDLFDTTAGSAAAAQAKIIDLTTGEIKIVDQGIVVKDGKSYYADKNGKASTNEVADLAAKDGAVNAIWKVAVLEDGSYVLVEAAEVKDVKTAKKAADFGVSGVVANSATVLTKVELTKDAKTGAIKSADVSSVTGIANFPDMKAAVEAIVVANKAGVATSILYVAEYKAPETKTYAIYTGAGEETADGQKLAFFQDGAAVEYYGTALDKDALYDITVADGKVTKADKVTAAAADKTVTVADDTFFKADSTLYFADKCTVVEKTESGYVEGELAVDDIVTYYTNTDGKVFFIVITGEVED